MGSLDRPKLRPLSAQRFEHEGRIYAALEDPLGVFTDPVLVPLEGFQSVVRHFDGATPLTEIQAARPPRDRPGPPDGRPGKPRRRLDRAMVLDGPTFGSFRDDYARQAVRPAAFAGRSYAGARRRLAGPARPVLRPGRRGRPASTPGRRADSLRGVVCPHIDFQRGGPVYTWAYKDLVERSDAEVFVILGVAHQYCANRFALTRKHFDTPLGLVKTDRRYVDRLAAHAGAHLFDDELAHRTEHSIEFQAVFLQYLLGGRRDFTIVPILVGSFHDLMGEGADPIESDEVRRFVEALRDGRGGDRARKVPCITIALCERGFRDPISAGNQQTHHHNYFDS